MIPDTLLIRGAQSLPGPTAGMPEPDAAAQQARNIEYLLNAFERASQMAEPAKAGYREKRRALLDGILAALRTAEARGRAAEQARRVS